ncbi:unnamed protein product [marine sediment metagenome]|uniref:Uncharacterized protein n=1 Tax=marine sediment metagenome TaxID=412755 RepID=X1BYV0_9ZZZZ
MHIINTGIITLGEYQNNNSGKDIIANPKPVIPFTTDAIIIITNIPK